MRSAKRRKYLSTKYDENYNSVISVDQSQSVLCECLQENIVPEIKGKYLPEY